jgi:hyperosmotically inducible periplasmic protein
VSETARRANVIPARCIGGDLAERIGAGSGSGGSVCGAEMGIPIAVIWHTHEREKTMKTKLVLASLIAGGLLVPALAYSADDQDRDREHPKAFVKDTAITAKVKSKLAAEHFGSLAQIHVDTEANGMVVLSGTARSQEQIDKAVSIARNTEHVRGVKNELTVKKDD